MRFVFVLVSVWAVFGYGFVPVLVSLVMMIVVVLILIQRELLSNSVLGAVGVEVRASSDAVAWEEERRGEGDDYGVVAVVDVVDVKLRKKKKVPLNCDCDCDYHRSCRY